MPTDEPDDVTSLAQKVRVIETYLGSTPIIKAGNLESRLSAIEKRIKALENAAGLNPRA